MKWNFYLVCIIFKCADAALSPRLRKATRVYPNVRTKLKCRGPRPPKPAGGERISKFAMSPPSLKLRRAKAAL